MQDFYYKSTHIPTGKVRVEHVGYHSRMFFLEDLNKWNQTGGGDWVYWEVSYLTYDEWVAQKEVSKGGLC